MANNTVLSAQEHAAAFTKGRRTIALIIVALAFVMDLVDNTIVNVAIPTIRTNLGASYAAIQWVVAGYALTFATLLVTGGRMGDVYGYKKLFMIGVGGFTIASLLSGLAMNPGMLVAARLLQGVCAALMVPQVMSLMQVMYKPEERGSINGLFGTLGGLGASLGPLLGGLLIQANIGGWDWRPIFLINIPIGLFALFMGMRFLPNGKSAHPLHLDIFGTVLIMLAIFLLVYPLIQGRDLDWPLWTFTMMLTALPVFALFAWWQKHKEQTDGSPLILPALFKNMSFGIGLAANFIFEMAIICFFLTFTLVLQIGFGFSVIHAALTGLPIAVGIALTMAIAGEKLVPMLGRYAMTIGSVIMAIGLGITFAVLHHYLSDVQSLQLTPGLLVIGVGMGFVFGSLFTAVLNGVDVRHAGSASGVLNAVQQVGGAVGVALIGVIFFGQLSSAAPLSFTSIQPELQQQLSAVHLPTVVQAEIINGVRACYVDRTREKDSATVPASCRVAEGLPTSSLTVAITRAAAQANATNFAHAFGFGIVYSVCLVALTFGLSFGLPRRFNSVSATRLERD